MTLNAKKITGNGSKDYPPPLEAGGYPGRLVRVIDLGLQKQRPYKGEEKPPANMLTTVWELSDEFMKDEDGNDLTDKPRWIWEEFPLFSLEADRAKSTTRYNALDPSHQYEGDWSQLVGVAANINIVQNPDSKDKTIIYNNVSNVTPLRAKDAAKLPDLVNEPVVFTLDDPDVEVFRSLPERIQKRIKEGLEFEGSLLDRRLSGEEDSIPHEGKDETNEEEGNW